MIKAAAQTYHAATVADEPRRMLNEQQVLAIIPMSRVTLWRMERAGKFPRSTYVSPNRRLWFADEIAAWQNEVDARDPRRRRGPGRRAKPAAEDAASKPRPEPGFSFDVQDS